MDQGVEGDQGPAAPPAPDEANVGVREGGEADAEEARSEAQEGGGDGSVHPSHRPSNLVGGRKNGEPDLEEKFGRFEIKPPPQVRPLGASHSLSEQGDETVSMVSDTWSTDVLASDTETRPGEADARGVALEDIVRREEIARNRMLDELVVPAAGGVFSAFYCS